MRFILTAVLSLFGLNVCAQTLTTINENLWTTNNSQYFDTASSYTVLSGSASVVGNAFSVGGSTFVVTGGNVGIGTASPGYFVDLQNASARANLQSTTGTNAACWQYINTGGTASIGIENSAGNSILGAGGLPYALAIEGPTAARPIQFAAGASNIVRMTVLDSGNIGIGTTSPGSKLHVSSGGVIIDGTTPVLTFANNSNSNDITAAGTSGRLIIDGDGGQAGAEITLNGSAQGASASKLILAGSSITFTNISGTARLTIDGSGNIGMGTTSPSGNLQVGSGSGATQSIVYGGNSSSGDGAYLKISNPSVTVGQIGAQSAIFGSTAYTNLTVYSPADVTINPGGNVRLETLTGTQVYRCAGGTDAGWILYGNSGAAQTLCTGGGGSLSATGIYFP